MNRYKYKISMLYESLSQWNNAMSYTKKVQCRTLQNDFIQIHCLCICTNHFEVLNDALTFFGITHGVVALRQTLVQLKYLVFISIHLQRIFSSVLLQITINFKRVQYFKLITKSLISSDFLININNSLLYLVKHHPKFNAKQKLGIHV